MLRTTESKMELETLKECGLNLFKKKKKHVYRHTRTYTNKRVEGNIQTLGWKTEVMHSLVSSFFSTDGWIPMTM